MTHTERIICPKCGHIQQAEVEHTQPFATYVHTCEECGYVITESEWNRIPPDKIYLIINDDGLPTNEVEPKPTYTDDVEYIRKDAVLETVENIKKRYEAELLESM